VNSNPLKYRPEIDGLRAIAILSVVFYHAELGFPGGFVGVDVFFVISGFLITSIILKDLEAGTFSLGAFWERRVRRIVPAALVMAVAVLVAGWFLFLPDDFQALAKSAISLSLFSVNFYFWQAIDYFSGPADELPLLHTWSLAVEEQFYLLAPFVLLLCHRLGGRRVSGVVLGVGFLASLACSIWMLPTAQAATFYLLPGRAWELLAGSMLAFLPARLAPDSGIWREILSALGLAGIFTAVFAYNDTTPFPGAAALLPCLGTALVIFANGPHARSRPAVSNLSLLGRLISMKPLVWIGLISYSLYLWHWPLFAFIRYFDFEEVPLALRWITVGSAFVLAALSWRFVETPFRLRRICRTRGAVFSFAGVGLVAVLVAGIGIYLGDGIPRRLSIESRNFASAQLEKSPVADQKLADILADNLTPIGVRDAKAPIDLLVWGDSHARAALPALEELGLARGISGRAVIHTATLPLLDYYSTSDFGLNEKAIPYGAAILDYIAKKKIRNVLLVAKWDREEKRNPEGLAKALTHTISTLRARGINVYVLMQVPSHRVKVPRALALDSMVHGDPTKWLRTVAEHQKLHDGMYKIAASLAGPGCVFLDPAPQFAVADGRHFRAIGKGHALYRDNHHLTRFAAVEILYPFLERTLKLVLGESTPRPE
jgi:peptidoglycan/LPS O-acetylase OafA/YrhL